jgi:hypothetical protein
LQPRLRDFTAALRYSPRIYTTREVACWLRLQTNNSRIIGVYHPPKIRNLRSQQSVLCTARIDCYISTDKVTDETLKLSPSFEKVEVSSSSPSHFLLCLFRLLSDRTNCVVGKGPGGFLYWISDRLKLSVARRQDYYSTRTKPRTRGKGCPKKQPI